MVRFHITRRSPPVNNCVPLHVKLMVCTSKSCINRPVRFHSISGDMEVASWRGTVTTSAWPLQQNNRPQLHFWSLARLGDTGGLPCPHPLQLFLEVRCWCNGDHHSHYCSSKSDITKWVHQQLAESLQETYTALSQTMSCITANSSDKTMILSVVKYACIESLSSDNAMGEPLGTIIPG